MAVKCKMVLVEQPMAISVRMAFSMAFSVIISEGLISAFSRSITRSPASFARRRRALITAGMVPEPGRDIPMVSVRQFMELAVYIPEQLPQVGQAV